MSGVLRVGLTGGIGAGKSTVARMLEARGALVVDADVLAREVVAAGTPGHAAVVAEFGAQVLAADGGLDRVRLGRLVFADQAARERLNAIVHPLVAQRFTELVDEAPPDAVVVHDVPLLAENGLAGRYDVVVVVEAAAPVRVSRLAESRGMSADEARSRMAAQATDDERRAVADVVLVNDGDRDRLAEQVEAFWRERVAPAR